MCLVALQLHDSNLSKLVSLISSVFASNTALYLLMVSRSSLYAVSMQFSASYCTLSDCWHVLKLSNLAPSIVSVVLAKQVLWKAAEVQTQRYECILLTRGLS